MACTIMKIAVFASVFSSVAGWCCLYPKSGDIDDICGRCYYNDIQKATMEQCQGRGYSRGTWCGEGRAQSIKAFDPKLGDRLDITCTTGWKMLGEKEKQSGVYMGEYNDNYVVALDATGKLEQFGKEGLVQNLQNRACLVKRDDAFDFKDGDRLDIFCNESGHEMFGQGKRSYVYFGQDHDHYVFALDATGELEWFGKEGAFQNPACFVKRGIVLNPGDFVEITGTAAKGRIGRLGQCFQGCVADNYGKGKFDVNLEDTGEVIMLQGAHVVKLPFTSNKENMDFLDSFKDHDKNRDGTVSPEEILSKWQSNSAIKTSCMRADQGSGVQEKKDVWFWCAGWAFRKYDKNLDKKISREEFVPYFSDFAQGRRLSEQTAVQV